MVVSTQINGMNALGHSPYGIPRLRRLSVIGYQLRGSMETFLLLVLQSSLN